MTETTTPEQQITLFKNALARSLATARQSYNSNLSDDPCIGIRLTDRQKGEWEGRIEILEHLTLISRETFRE